MRINEYLKLLQNTLATVKTLKYTKIYIKNYNKSSKIYSNYYNKNSATYSIILKKYNVKISSYKYP